MTTVEAPRQLLPLLSSGQVRQRAFGWPRSRWEKWLTDVKGAERSLEGLPAELDRPATAGIVQRNVESDDYAAAFVAAMVWGHGYSGYGPYRTAWALTSSRTPRSRPVEPAVVRRLRESCSMVRQEGPVASYRYLNNRGHIAGLGPAFFTKWLYFSSADGRPYGDQAAPILDALITFWLRENAGVQLRYGRTSDYETYLDLLHEWGTPHGRNAVEVEEAIFRLIRDDGVELEG